MTGVRFCTNCGRALGEQDAFCNNCGKEAFSQAVPPIPPPVPPPLPPPNHGLILIAVALVALLILAGVGYALIAGWEDPDTEYQTGYGTESFSWSYDHIRYTLMVDIPLADYQSYVDDPIDRGLTHTMTILWRPNTSPPRTRRSSRSPNRWIRSRPNRTWTTGIP